MNNAPVTVVPGVLVVDNEPVLSGTVKDCLEWAGTLARTCRNGLVTLDFVRATVLDVMVLDLGLPSMDGVEMCRQLCAFGGCYALVLTACAGEVDKLIRLSADADGYMTRLSSPRELVVRIQVLLKHLRAGSMGATVVMVHRIGVLTLGPPSRQVGLNAPPVELTRTEFGLLQALAEHSGQALNRHQFTDVVWGEDWVGDDHLIDVHIAHLRKKLGDGPSQLRFVQTVRGVGYRMGQEQ